jgi:hypothetical protein
MTGLKTTENPVIQDNRKSHHEGEALRGTPELKPLR